MQLYFQWQLESKKESVIVCCCHVIESEILRAQQKIVGLQRYLRFLRI